MKMNLYLKIVVKIEERYNTLHIAEEEDLKQEKISIENCSQCYVRWNSVK